ncbi:MAG: TatD family hydrolase [Candidatus Eisenbacteria bacterium]
MTYAPKKSDLSSPRSRRACGAEIFVLETDCPYLTPHPRRNERNEPASIPLIADALADYLSLTVGEVERMTDQAARLLFQLDS